MSPVTHGGMNLPPLYGSSIQPFTKSRVFCSAPFQQQEEIHQLRDRSECSLPTHDRLFGTRHRGGPRRDCPGDPRTQGSVRRHCTTALHPSLSFCSCPRPGCAFLGSHLFHCFDNVHTEIKPCFYSFTDSSY